MRTRPYSGAASDSHDTIFRSRRLLPLMYTAGHWPRKTLSVVELELIVTVCMYLAHNSAGAVGDGCRLAVTVWLSGPISLSQRARTANLAGRV